MKKIIAIICFLHTLIATQAQEVIKVGEEKTMTCTGSFIAETQHYFSIGKPSSKGRYFVDASKDSLIFFAAYIDEGSSHTVYRYAIAKKDVDMGDWGFEIEAVKENGVAFQLLKIKSVDSNSIIKEEKYSWGEVEVNDPTNSVAIYFMENKLAEAKQWVEKIKQLIQQ